MKKLIAVLLILALLGTMAMAEAADVVGTWYAVEVVVEGQTFSPADFGIEVIVTLNEDGTATMDGVGDAAEGTWTIDGDTVTITEKDAEDTVMTLVDGKLTMSTDETTMVFSQEAPEAFVPAAAIEAALEDFTGIWKAEQIGLEGQYYSVSLLGADVTATIEDATLTLDGFLFSNNSFPVEYADGVLSFSKSDDESGEQVDIRATLLEDGMLMVNLDAGEQGAFAFYLVPAEAAEAAPAA